MPNSDDIDARVAAFTQIAEDHVMLGIIPNAEIVLRLVRVRLAVKGYFILNRAYKRWKINASHLTQEEKIAALMCMSIATFKPFRPVDPNKVSSIGAAKANEIYSLACASSIIGARLKFNFFSSSNMMFRIMDIMTASHSETLEPFIVDAELGIEKQISDYDTISIKDGDKMPLNALITIFELLPRT